MNLALRCSTAVFWAAAVLAPAAATAQDNGIYLGASMADVSTDYKWRSDLLASAADDEASGFKLIGGVRPLDSFAIEANYVDLGTADAPLAITCAALVGFPCPSEASIDASAVSVSALGMLTLPFLDFYGRLGVARWKAEGDVRFTDGGTGLATRTKHEGTDLTYGFGMQVRFTSIAVRVEYERFKVLDDSADTVSVGFTYTFL